MVITVWTAETTNLRKTNVIKRLYNFLNIKHPVCRFIRYQNSKNKIACDKRICDKNSYILFYFDNNFHWLIALSIEGLLQYFFFFLKKTGSNTRILSVSSCFKQNQKNRFDAGRQWENMMRYGMLNYYLIFIFVIKFVFFRFQNLCMHNAQQFPISSHKLREKIYFFCQFFLVFFNNIKSYRFFRFYLHQDSLKYAYL